MLVYLMLSYLLCSLFWNFSLCTVDVSDGVYCVFVLLSVVICALLLRLSCAWISFCLFTMFLFIVSFDHCPSIVGLSGWIFLFFFYCFFSAMIDSVCSFPLSTCDLFLNSHSYFIDHFLILLLAWTVVRSVFSTFGVALHICLIYWIHV